LSITDFNQAWHVVCSIKTTHDKSTHKGKNSIPIYKEKTAQFVIQKYNATQIVVTYLQ
jgi:hypothetical protein